MGIKNHMRIGGHSTKNERSLGGRKPERESRATEFRRTLIDWKRTPESSRLPLRALARELGTSHQLLTFYLKSFEKWQIKEHWRQAHEIRTRAIAEGRALTECEEHKAHAHTRAAVRAIVGPALRRQIEHMKEESERGPLCSRQIKLLKILSREFPEARELLENCSQDSGKDQKR